MSRRQSIALFTLSAILSFIVLSLSIFILDEESNIMPTLASLAQSPAPAQVSFTAHDDKAQQVENQFVVRLDDTTTSTTLDDILNDFNAEIITDMPQLQAAVVEFKTPIEADQLDTLSSSVLIEPNYRVQSLFSYPTNDPLLNDQWAWTKIDIPRLWASVDDTTDVTIAVIDSGVCFNHPDLQGRFLDNGFDFVDNDDDPSDVMGHGCAISGIIAAHIDNGIGIAGIAPHAKILPIRVLDAQGVGTYANVMSAIHYAVDNGADIINLSLGGQNYSQLLEQAVNYATDNGVHVVAGSGNTGQQGVLYPAKFDSVIAVGSSDVNGNRSIFSTYGNEVDTLAPGENIITTALSGGYSSFTGTSMAAPHVSALLALSDDSVDTVDFAKMMPTVDPFTLTMEAVEALEVPTNTPTAMVFTPTPSPFQCSDLRLESAFPTGNYLQVEIFNSGFATTLESIEVQYPTISAYPNLYISRMMVESNEFWIGDGTLTSPVYIDDTVLSYDNVDRWTPVNPSAASNTSTYFHVEFLESPADLTGYLSTNDMAGTKLSFYNPADPQSPCEIRIPEDFFQIQPSPTPSSLQCSDLRASLEFIGGNIVFIHLLNLGNDTDLESIDWHFANASDPNAYINLLYIGDGSNWYKLWDGDESSISPVYMDYDEPSPDRLYHWQYADLRTPYNAPRILQLNLLNVTSPLDNTWTEDDFTGTTFSFYNPADPQSPCVLTVPEDLDEVPPLPTPEPSATPDNTPLNPPYAECGTTGIELAEVYNNTIYYHVADVATPQDYLVDMDHVVSSLSAPISGTPSISNITFNGNTIWTSVSATSIDNGTWLSSPTLDDDVLGIHYNVGFDLRHYYLPEDFESSFHVYNNIANSYCTTYPTVSDDLTESVLSEPENLTALKTVSGTQLDWDMTDTGIYDSLRIYRQISGVDSDPQLLNTFYDDSTSYLDTIPFVCNRSVQYKVQSTRWSAYQGQDVDSPPALVDFIPSLPDCINLLPPTEFTATRVDGGVELNWTPANEIYNYHIFDYRIVGQGEEFSAINYNSIGTYTHNVTYQCDVTEVEYRIRTRYHDPELGWSYSDPVIIVYSEVCPQTDLELEITSNIPSPSPYTPVEITLTLKNVGNETAHDIDIRQFDLASYYVIDHTTSKGTYSPYTKYWALEAIAPQSEETLTFTLLTQQDLVTGEQPIAFEIRDADAIDPDSIWDNNNPLEDDYAATTLGLTCPTSDVFTVADGDSDGLLQAISTANYETCFPGQDTITLAQDGSYIIDKWAVHDLEGWNAFPPISSNIVVDGNGSTIDGDRLVTRLFYVTDVGILNLSDIDLIYVYQDNDFEGSIVFNHGITRLDTVDIYYNSSTRESYSLIHNRGTSSEIEIHNSYLGLTSALYAIVVEEGSSALVENSIINGSLTGIGGSLVSNFSTYYNSDIGKIGDTRDVTLLGNVFDNLTGQYTCSSHVPAIIREGVTSLGYNVSRACSYGHPTDLGGFEDSLVLQPIYTPDVGFRDYPKPTEGSPIIDLIPAEICDNHRDYGGAYRPQDSNGDTLVACNAGAYEADYNGFILATHFDNTSPADNDLITLHVELSNQTDTDASDVAVSMDSIHELDYLGAMSSTSGSLSLVSGTPQWTMDTLAANSTEMIELSYLVDLPLYRQYNSVLTNYALTHESETKQGNHISTINTGCPSLAHAFNIPAGNSYALENAILLANDETCAPGANTITLAPDSEYIIDGSYEPVGYSVATLLSALPNITSDITIIGNGSTLKPSESDKRALWVTLEGSLSLQQVTVTDFNLDIGNTTDAVIFSKGHLHIADSEIIDNNAPFIVYVLDESTTSVIERSLIWNNTTTRDHYAVYIYDAVDAIIQNNTIGQDDTRPAQNGIYSLAENVDILFNTIVGDTPYQYTVDTHQSGHTDFVGNLVINATCRKSSPWISRYDVSNTTTCDLRQTGDLQSVPITFLPLGDYGGYTRTIVPFVESASIDHVPLEFCLVSTDQRGISRPVNDNCDAGAVEFTHSLNAPLDVQVVNDVDTAKIDISWVDNSTDETSFTVVRKGTNDASWQVLGIVAADTTQFIDTDILSCSQTYDYSVYASDNNGGFSPIATPATTINFSCGALTVPLLAVTAVSQTSPANIIVDLSWIDDNTNFTGWNISQQIDDGGWVSLTSVTDPQLQHALVCESNYDFRVQAYRESDTIVSDWSNVVSFTAGTCPQAPVFDLITGTGFNQIEVTLSPYLPDDALIRVEYREAGSADSWTLGNEIQSDQLTPLSYAGLLCGVDYEFRTMATVTTVDSVQVSSWSDTTIGMTHDCVPMDIPVLSLTPISSTDIPGTNANLTWTDSNAINTHFLVEYREDSGTWKELVRLTDTRLHTTYLECETSYDYRIRAYQGELNTPDINTLSGWSNIASYTTGECSSVPVVISIDPYKSDIVKITWQAEPGNDRYIRLYKKPGDAAANDPWDDNVSEANMYSGSILSYLPACGMTYQYGLEQRWYHDSKLYVSEISEPQIGSSFECLTPPTNLTTISSTENELTFSWENTTARTDYETIISAFDPLSGEWEEFDRIPTTQTQYTVSCLAASNYRLHLYQSTQDEYSPYSDSFIISGSNCFVDTPQSGPTYTVTTTDDLPWLCGETYCSLRGAIEAANEQAGANTIILPDGTYVTQIDGVYEDNNRTGDYDVLDHLTILGNASGTAIIDGGEIDRLFDIGTDIDFSINNVTLQNSNSVLWHDYLEIPGGLIDAYYSGDISITNSILQDGFGYIGGAIHVESSDSVTIHKSIFKNNTSDSFGGAVSLYSVDTIVTDSIFENNTSQNNQGGAINQSFDTISIYNSVFRNNVSALDGGAISVHTLGVIDNSLFIDNQAQDGGAIHGVINGIIKNSSVINNHATNSGGGIFMWEGVTVENVTISGNTAENSGGGVFDYGGNTIVNSTIVNNQATNASTDAMGGGLYVDKIYDRYPTVRNTILANNQSDIASSADCHVTGDNTGTITNSVIESTSTCDVLNNITNSYFGVDAAMSSLQSLGDAYYHNLLAGNPAINNADDALCPTTDQLGNSRPVGVYCDMGAVESPYTLNPPTNLTGTNVQYANVLLNWQDNSNYNTSTIVQRSLDGESWNGIATLAADTVSYTDPALQCPQDYYYRVLIATSSFLESSVPILVSLDYPCEPLKFLSPISSAIVDDATAQITWSDDNADESGYRIMRRITGTWSEIGVVAPNLTLFNDSTINCNADLIYDYQVQAYRDVDDDETDSNITSIWTGDCPFYDPTGFTSTEILDEQVTLSWADNSILESSYILSRKTPSTNWIPIATLLANTTTYSDVTVVCESQYQYKLQGYQALFDRSTNAVSTAVTTAKCEVAIPDAITTTVASSQTLLQWKPLPPQQTPQIFVERAEQTADAVVGLSGEQSLNWQLKATLGGGASVFTDHDLRCGMNYFYRIQGYNSRYNEYTSYSDTIQITTNECPVAVTNTIGVYRDGYWAFRNGFEGDALLTSFRFGPLESGWIPLSGDWDGDGIDGIGLYKDGVFALRDLSDHGIVDYLYHFGNTTTDWQPLVGDWDGDGAVTVGLYRDGQFMLTNSHESPSVDYQFRLNGIDNGWIPIAGDWYGYGRDLVGLYKDGMFSLLNSLNRNADVASFQFGSGDGWIPLAGDWDADGISTIGLYKDNNWRLRNSNRRGNVDIGFRFNGLGDGTYPLASYRGGEEAIEALALFATSVELNVNPDATDAVNNIATTPTLSPTVETAVSPTQVESTPTITSAISATATEVEPTLMIPTSATATEVEPTITPTNEPLLTATDEPVPTATVIPVEPTVEPTAIPSATPIPDAEPEATDEIQDN